MPVPLGCVVEGHGEVESVPSLLRRIAHDFDPALALTIPHAVRVMKSRLVQSGELEKSVQLAALNAPGGGILVLLDSDDDLPCQLGPALLARVRSARQDMPSAVVLAKREFESWFLAAADSLRGRRRLPEDLTSPDDPEGISGAKEWLSRRILDGAYSPTADQAALTNALDLNLARRAPSFDKCYREVTRLLRELRPS